MAAERLVAFHELREKLAGLEEGLRVAEGELKALEAKRSRLEQSEQEKGTVLETYAAMAQEGLETLTSEGAVMVVQDPPIRGRYRRVVRWRLA
jgi:DNA repair exonuclease SbcCD ATPase subunit